MYLLDRRTIRDELGSLYDMLGEGLSDHATTSLQQDVEELSHLSVSDAYTLDLLGERVDRHKTSADSLLTALLVHLGMVDAVRTIEEYRPAKDEISLSYGIETLDRGERAKPNQLDRPRAIGEIGYESLLSPFAYLLVVSDIAT